MSFISRLAVIIPFYKIKYFEETLASLAAQTSKNFKVYIGNDASPDDPMNIISSYSEKINITYTRFEENLGSKSLTKQWNRCIEMIQDEKWFMILGDDDYLSANYVQEFHYNLDEINGLDIRVVRSATKIKYQSDNEITGLHRHPVLETSTDFFYRRTTKSLYSSLSEYIYQVDSYKKYGFKDFPLAWGSDIVAWLEFSELGNIYTLNNATAFIRISNENISRNGYKEDIKLKAKSFMFSYVIENYLYKFRKKQRLPLLLIFQEVLKESHSGSFRNWRLLFHNVFKNSFNRQVFKVSALILRNLFQLSKERTNN